VEKKKLLANQAELASEVQGLRGDLSKAVDARKTACTCADELGKGLVLEREQVASLRKKVEEVSFELQQMKHLGEHRGRMYHDLFLCAKRCLPSLGADFVGTDALLDSNEPGAFLELFNRIVHSLEVATPKWEEYINNASLTLLEKAVARLFANLDCLAPDLEDKELLGHPVAPAEGADSAHVQLSKARVAKRTQLFVGKFRRGPAPDDAGEGAVLEQEGPEAEGSDSSDSGESKSQGDGGSSESASEGSDSAP
jgi:hypothetical protein